MVGKRRKQQGVYVFSPRQEIEESQRFAQAFPLHTVKGFLNVA